MVNLNDLFDEIDDIYKNRYKNGYQKFVPLFIRLKNYSNIDLTIDHIEGNYDDIEIDMDLSKNFAEMWFWDIKYNLSISENDGFINISEKYNNIRYNYKINNNEIVFDFAEDIL